MKELICFIVLACVLSWPVLGLWTASPGDPADAQKAFEKLSPLFALGPFISAIVSTLLFRGRAGLKSLFKPVIKWRIGWRWYLLALTIPVLVQWAALVGWRLWTSAEPSLPSMSAALRLWCMGTPITAIFLITEETGWRGFCLPRVQTFAGALSAGLVVGAVWAFWHTPLWIAIERSAGSSAAMAAVGVGIFFVMTMCFSVLMTWVFNSSGGSLLPMLLMHGSNNVSLYLAANALNKGGLMDLPFKVIWTLVMALAVGLVLMRYGRRSLSASDKVIDKIACRPKS